MSRAIEKFQDQLLGIHSRTVSAGLLDTVKVPWEGQRVPLQNLASTAPRASGVEVFPHDPGTHKLILKALQDAGFQAYQFSKVALMVQVPEITGESKKLVISRIKQLGEEAKIAIRNTRKHHRTPDDRAAEKALQVATDKAIQEVDRVVEYKIKSL